MRRSAASVGMILLLALLPGVPGPARAAGDLAGPICQLCTRAIPASYPFPPSAKRPSRYRLNDSFS